ncbi:MAG: hypothetical protein PHP50_00875 [Lachnospiraceae bacterium]|nr:hypothetical protein [Lachnospiraceae bacterium]
MVFRNETWNHTGDIVVYSNYHKYWLDRERKIKSPLFDVFSGKILDLKEGKSSAINYFYNLVDAEICDGVTIFVVPSSNVEKHVTGITQLGEQLALNNRI